MILIEHIETATMLDDADRDRQSKEIERLYAEATDSERELLDKVFVCMCGWRLRTLIDVAEAV
jgi:hypothetical protein